MSQRRFVRTTIVAAVAILSIILPGTATSAAVADRTRPTTPLWGYSQGFYCLMLILGTSRSTDNVTPQSQLRYEAFADGVFLGTLTDYPTNSGPWGVLHLRRAGPNYVTVRAVDAAGNRSAPSRANLVTGYYTPGCTPGHL
jgi:hypothetical protein